MAGARAKWGYEYVLTHRPSGRSVRVRRLDQSRGAALPVSGFDEHFRWREHEEDVNKALAHRNSDFALASVVQVRLN
jgi:hypothetical protein